MHRGFCNGIFSRSDQRLVAEFQQRRRSPTPPSALSPSLISPLPQVNHTSHETRLTEQPLLKPAARLPPAPFRCLPLPPSSRASHAHMPSEMKGGLDARSVRLRGPGGPRVSRRMPAPADSALGRRAGLLRVFPWLQLYTIASSMLGTFYGVKATPILFRALTVSSPSLHTYMHIYKFGQIA